jgi:hypothetical protein
MLSCGGITAQLVSELVSRHELDAPGVRKRMRCSEANFVTRLACPRGHAALRAACWFPHLSAKALGDGAAADAS